MAASLSLPFTPLSGVGQTAKDIVDHHVAALGGAEALHAIQAMRYLRTVQNTEGGRTTVQSRTTFTTRRPFFYRSERPEAGFVYISDGVNAWRGRRDGDAGPITWSTPRFVLAARDTDFDRPFGSFIDYEGKGNQATYLGETQLGGVTLHAVRFLWSDGVEWDVYFDPATGLCHGWDSSPGQPGGLVRVDDYRNVEGTLVPHRNTVVDTLANGAVRVHERLYSEFEFNPDLPDDLFRPVMDPTQEPSSAQSEGTGSMDCR